MTRPRSNFPRYVSRKRGNKQKKSRRKRLKEERAAHEKEIHELTAQVRLLKKRLRQQERTINCYRAAVELAEPRTDDAYLEGRLLRQIDLC